ncbi:MAG: sulfite exporter TauE/SafE family protein [Planctomycetes bacterium]|nr:sulfite exporter TauE/SafE family protein [Planctomycetota bacterium]
MELDAVEIVIRLVLGLFIGFTIGLTGVGGGSLVLPALTVLLGMPSTAAVGTASLYAFLTKIYAGFEHFRRKNIHMRVAIVFLIGAVPANVLCSYWISSFKDKHSIEEVASFNQYLTYFIALVMVVSVVLMLVNLMLKNREKNNAEAAKSDGTIEIKGKNIAIGITCGALVGGLIGSTSVGGGVIVVPLLILLFKMPTTRTVGTSIFIALILTLVTALIYGKGGEMDYETALIMTAGSFAGVYFGSKLCAKIPERPLQIVVISLICVSAIMMLF